MARRAFLHIGTPKSGTTFVQSLWWRNAERMAAQGLLLPGGSKRAQFRAAAVIRDNAPVLATMGERQRATWDRMLAEISNWDGDVLLTQEQLVETDASHAAEAVRRLSETSQEVHVLITVRDLARQVPSAWQQRVKQGSPSTLRRFCQRVAQDDPTFNFWTHHDVPRILERWGADLPSERLHVLPLPPAGADPQLLWNRTRDLLDFDDTGFDLTAPVSNETFNAAQIEFYRRVNTHFDNAHQDVPLSRRVKGYLVPRLSATNRSGQRTQLPADSYDWVVARGNRMADELAAAAWHVIGDLDDLRPDPVPGPGVDPDTISDADVAAVAAELVSAEILTHVSEPVPPQPAPAEDTAVRGVVRRLTRRR